MLILRVLSREVYLALVGLVQDELNYLHSFDRKINLPLPVIVQGEKVHFVYNFIYLRSVISREGRSKRLR